MSGASAAPGGRLNLPDDLWHATLAAYPFLQAVPAADRNRLRDLSTRFLREKEFHGVAGLEVTDAMAIAVAAQACLPKVFCLGRAPTRTSMTG